MIAAKIVVVDDSFFTTKKVGESTAPGLSISYTLISDLGGELTASNRSEGGALFRIELPRAGRR